jgi:hypothetical protein
MHLSHIQLHTRRNPAHPIALTPPVLIAKICVRQKRYCGLENRFLLVSKNVQLRFLS